MTVATLQFQLDPEVKMRDSKVFAIQGAGDSLSFDGGSEA
jgi:hypothetical protein